MPQQRTHVVHLAVTCRRISPVTVDLFHDDGSFGEAETGPTILRRYHGGEPAGVGESLTNSSGYPRCSSILRK